MEPSQKNVHDAEALAMEIAALAKTPAVLNASSEATPVLTDVLSFARYFANYSSFVRSLKRWRNRTGVVCYIAAVAVAASATNGGARRVGAMTLAVTGLAWLVFTMVQLPTLRLRRIKGNVSVVLGGLLLGLLICGAAIALDDPRVLIVASVATAAFTFAWVLLASVGGSYALWRHPTELRQRVVVDLADALSLALFGYIHRYGAQDAHGPPVRIEQEQAEAWWLVPSIRDALANELQTAEYMLTTTHVQVLVPSQTASHARAMREFQLRVAGGFATLASAATLATPTTGPRITASLAAGYVAALDERWDELAQAKPLSLHASRRWAVLVRLAIVGGLTAAGLWLVPLLPPPWNASLSGVLLSAAIAAIIDPKKAVETIAEGVGKAGKTA